MTTLDVLLIESHPDDGGDDAALLEAQGHRVHRCWDRAEVPARSPSAFAPCAAFSEEGCPLDAGVDVALLVRRGVAPRTSDHEIGARCALRASVPLVEDGCDLLDPFAGWLAGRVDGDVVAACEAAAGAELAAVADEVRRHAAPALARAGVDASAIDVQLEALGDQLRVRLSGPPLGERDRQALSVRALAVLGDLRRPFTSVGVGYREAGPRP